MGQYGEAAVKATKLCCDGSASSPEEAWEKAVCEVTESPSSQKEPCPRCAYLGLCEEGEVSGILKGNYRSNSVKNKRYAVNALSLLRQNPSEYSNEKTLWEAVMKDEEKGPNGKMKIPHGQIDVVLSLGREGLIAGQRKLDN